MTPTMKAAVIHEPGGIELQLCGRIKVRLEGEVNKDVLRRVLAVARDFA